MKIVQVHSCSDSVLAAVQEFMNLLSPRMVTRERLEALLSSGASHLFFGVDDNGRALGMVTLGIYGSPSGVKAWIEDVVVGAESRGCGYGRALAQHAVEFARSLGADAVCLTSHPSRVAANALYRSMGFVLRETNLYRMEI